MIVYNSFTPELTQVILDHGFKIDRLPGDYLQLPNELYDIKVKVNDYIISETINYSLNKLYSNWLYLISNSVIPSNNIPNENTFTHMIVDIGSGPEWRDRTEFTSLTSTITNNTFNDVRNITKVQNTREKNNYNLIASTQTNLMLLSGTNITDINLIINPNNPNNIIVSDSSVTHPSNEILFRDIKGHVVSDERELFVLDGYHKTVFKFDISGILTLDDAILLNDTPGRLMIGMIGGSGEVTDKTKFSSPIIIETANNLIYILDSSDAGTYVKLFDSELNWKQSYNITQYVSSGPIDLKYNPGTDNFYVLCHRPSFYDFTTMELTEPLFVEFDQNFNHIKTSKLIDHDKQNPDISREKYKRLRFSIENTNVMYILTESNVYKKYVTRPTEFIGNFLLNEKQIGTGSGDTMTFQDIFIFEDETSNQGVVRDEILLLESQFETIFKFKEDSAYEKSLETAFDQKVLYNDDLVIQDEEFVSTFTYNKIFTKHLYNNLLLLENTSRKFSTKYDIKGISRYIGFMYLTDSEIDTLTYEVKPDNYIGNNEIVLSSTVNRCLQRILDLQKIILTNMQEKPINVYPLVNVPVQLDPCD